MKQIISIILFLVPLFVNAQSDKITEVCGVKLGSSLTSAKTILNEKFGEPFNETDNSLTYCFKSYGGVDFTVLCFEFAKSGSRTYLNEITFFSIHETKAEAEKHKEQIAEAVRRNYSLTKETDSDGIKYKGGISPLNSNHYGFVISVFKNKNEEYPWTSRLRYGPYGYGDSF
ncbi:MAG: hypothetical protein SPK85_00615 [Prevotella sp.]|nr:hypothetical protein [Prevotella sp.]